MLRNSKILVWKKTQGDENLKATIPNTDYDRPNSEGDCGML